jgi:beta-lactamase regulating signal transducer with metallopeptidase domain
MDYLLKASAVIILFYGCYKLCLQRDTFFEESRWFLLVGLIASIIVPFIVIPVYMEQTTIAQDNLFFDNNSSAEVSDNAFNFLTILNYIYLIGVIIFSTKFLLQLNSLYAVIFKTDRNKNGRYTFIQTAKATSPFSFFNYIVYNPNQFNSVELEQIISHEKVHVKQFHTVDVLLAQLACIAFWFNPFIWLYNKDLKQNLEFIADKTAINHINCKKSYQYTLLKTSVPNQQLALTNNFYNSLIKKRIVMLHKSKSKKINLLKFALIIPVLALFLMSFNTKTVIIEKNPVKATIDNHSNITLQEPYKVIITKDTSKEDLDQIIEEAKNKGVTLKFKGIKRNSNNEIIAISASFKNKNGSGNYYLKDDEPITSFAFYQKKDSFGFTGIREKSELKELIFISEDGEKHKVNHSDAEANVFIYSSDGKTYSDKDVDKIVIKSKDTFYIKKTHKTSDLHENVIFMSKDDDEKDDEKVYKLIRVKEGDKKGNNTWITDEEDVIFMKSKSKDDKVKIISKNGKDPIYIVDGNEISKEEMDDILPDNIEKVEVLKGEKATEKYGDKGKNGVILITTKK